MSATTTAQVLTAAKGLLVNSGWIRSEMRSPRGFCTAGAILCAAETQFADHRPAIQVVIQALRESGYEGPHMPPAAAYPAEINVITFWNDHHCDDKAQAIALLDAALLLLSPEPEAATVSQPVVEAPRRRFTPWHPQHKYATAELTPSVGSDLHQLVSSSK